MNQGVFFNSDTQQWEKRDPSTSAPVVGRQGVEFVGGEWADRPTTAVDPGDTDNRITQPRVHFDHTLDDWVQSAGRSDADITAHQGVYFDKGLGEWTNR